MSEKAIVLSCEHGGCEVPDSYSHLFKKAEKTLKSHRGYDVGALELYNSINNTHIVYKQGATTTRLLVDINRSLHRRTLFSEFSKPLPQQEKEKLLDTYYYGFRKPFEEKIKALWQQNKTVLHVSVHSFTPVLNGDVRQTDFGILYNPERKAEKEFAQLWKKELNKILPHHRVRFNYPYRGKPDGHVRYFRDREETKYLGIEFELNQKHATNEKMRIGIADAFKIASALWVQSNP